MYIYSVPVYIYIRQPRQTNSYLRNSICMSMFLFPKALGINIMCLFFYYYLREREGERERDVQRECCLFGKLGCKHRDG